LIGSNSIETAGDLYILNLNAITQPNKVRQKRTLDILVGLMSLLLFPVLIWFFDNKFQWVKNSWQLLIGKKTLVGYGTKAAANLPRIKKGILRPNEQLLNSDETLAEKLDLLYAREYNLLTDLQILLRSWKKLDRQS
jgi:lipopolysaccharide/colanic/teichoic acid biosynthesis glycosyltransferase